MCPSCINHYVEAQTDELLESCARLEKMRRGSWALDGYKLAPVPNPDDYWIDKAQDVARKTLQILIPMLVESVKHKECPHVQIPR